MDRADALWEEYQVLRVAGSASEIRLFLKQRAFVVVLHVPRSKATIPLQSLLKEGLEHRGEANSY